MTTTGFAQRYGSLEKVWNLEKRFSGLEKIWKIDIFVYVVWKKVEKVLGTADSQFCD